MMQKGDPYIKLFSTLSTLRVVSYILSQLNIICNSQVKPHYTKNDNSPVFTAHMLRPLCIFSNILYFIEVNWSIYQYVQYFIRRKNRVLNFTTI